MKTRRGKSRESNIYHRPKCKYTLNEQLIELQNWRFCVKIESVLLFIDKMQYIS